MLEYSSLKVTGQPDVKHRATSIGHHINVEATHTLYYTSLLYERPPLGGGDDGLR